MAEILIIDDDRNLRETLGEIFIAAGYRVRSAADGEKALALLASEPVDAVLCDWKMPVAGGEQVLKALSSSGSLASMPVIIMTAHGDGPNAMQAMQLGAYDFVTKPLDMDEVLATVARAIEHARLQKEVEQLRMQRFRHRSYEFTEEEPDDRTPRLIGSSQAWIDVFKSIGKVARTDVSVLLLGETGTGKEIVARTIHDNSGRSTRPFIVINCAAIPAELIESELFGHERGAFTSAIAQKIGKFEAANGGTIFLDEIGELPLALQPKLLRVLQEKTFERVGGTKLLNAAVRVIAATNRSLEEEVEERSFRPDLFYRLNAFTLRLPPLRERRTDILPLAEYFLSQYDQRNSPSRSGLTEDAAIALQQYSFPGNVRELEHLMERLAVKASGGMITGRQVAGELAPDLSASEKTLQQSSLEGLPFHESVAGWEKHLIEKAIKAADGNKSNAARRLGIHRRLLYEKLQQLGIGE